MSTSKTEQRGSSDPFGGFRGLVAWLNFLGMLKIVAIAAVVVYLILKWSKGSTPNVS